MPIIRKETVSYQGMKTIKTVDEVFVNNISVKELIDRIYNECKKLPDIENLEKVMNKSTDSFNVYYETDEECVLYCIYEDLVCHRIERNDSILEIFK